MVFGVEVFMVAALSLLFTCQSLLPNHLKVNTMVSYTVEQRFQMIKVNDENEFC